MSVAAHLGINLAQYDQRIRTFIPNYDEMLDSAAAMLSPRTATILDLGIGTGALAARCLAVAHHARIVGIDSDPSMLEMARRRLGDRMELIHGHFETVVYPHVDAIVASLALHHIRSESAKTALYRQLFQALPLGGLLINADCCPANDAYVSTIQRRAWRGHLRRTYTPGETTEYFRSWSREDVYMPLDVELRMLKACGFDVDVSWRRGMFAVVVARRHG